MLLILRHLHPALATIVGGILGVCFVALGATTHNPLFIVNGAMSVVLSIVRTNHNLRGAGRHARS
jgi:hypothetical protein